MAVKVVEQSVTDKMLMMKLPKEVERNNSSTSLDDQIKAFEVTTTILYHNTSDDQL